MSGGTPRGANLMRQRHSWGYASGGEDLDACSKPMPSPPSIPREKTRIEIMENVLWIGSVVFIIYFGDWHSNLIYLLWHDDRIRRFTWALWPIGSFLTLPLVFTLFMACMVISPYLKSGIAKKTPPEVLRQD